MTTDDTILSVDDIVREADGAIDKLHIEGADIIAVLRQAADWLEQYAPPPTTITSISANVTSGLWSLECNVIRLIADTPPQVDEVPDCGD